MDTIFSNWMLLSLLAAFGQAYGWALKKKSLENRGVNNTLGAVSFFVAGISLLLLWGLLHNWNWPMITFRFVFASFVIIVVNVLAVWAAYRALDKEALSMLMPLVSLTALLIVPLEYIIRSVIPNIFQICGIVLVIIGAITFAPRRPTKKSLTAIKYFLITLVCYSIAPPFQGIAVDETSSGLFSASIFHLGIAIGFVPLIMLSGEYRMVVALGKSKEIGKILLLMILAGLVIAFFENGPATVALETAKASEVFGLKRTMPFFSLLIGAIMFGEKITAKHVFGTIFLVIGSICIVWFRT